MQTLVLSAIVCYFYIGIIFWLELHFTFLHFQQNKWNEMFLKISER